MGTILLIPVGSGVPVLQGTYGRYTYAAPAHGGATPPVNVGIFIYNSLPSLYCVGGWERETVRKSDEANKLDFAGFIYM